MNKSGLPTLPTLPTVDSSRLEEVARQFDLDLIVLFGSFAKGQPRPQSDVDVAVHTTRSDYGHDTCEDASWEMALFEALSDVIPAGDGIDLVVLNRANSTLLFQVARHGIPLHLREPTTFRRFQSYAARRFYDDEKFRRARWEYLKRRYIGGTQKTELSSKRSSRA